MTRTPFNDYDENGWRIDHTGQRRSRIVDCNALDNIRFAWPELARFSDVEILNEYYEFSYHNESPTEDGFPAWMESNA